MGKPVSRFTDSFLRIEEVFGAEGKTLGAALLSLEDDERMIACAERLLRGRLPERDPNVELIRQIVERVITDREMRKVDDIAERFGLNKRALQRLFRQYVGVGPKWVIQRYRLHEAADLLANGGDPDWARLAADLGYYDQAHLIKDFKLIVGKSPEENVRKSIEPGERADRSE